MLTVKPEGWRTAEQSVTKLGSKLLPIGHVVDGGEVTLAKHGERRPSALKGWEHFKQ